MAASSCRVSTLISEEGHDVFLSFRGKDTRDNFTSHLYAGLCRKTIKTFIDSEGLRSGDDISPSLIKTIEGSKLALVIFSENYASSPWCLEELAKILHCKKTSGQSVVPVFHNVDPSVIRHQIGSFKEAFDKHEVRQKRDKVQNWRASLTEAASLSGWDSRVIRPESKLIEKIVEDVLYKSSQKSSTYFQGLVGIHSRIKKVESLLRLDSPDVCSVGIWGMGGIGKTTIAKAVFDHLYSQFEGFYFLENVKEELKRCGKVSLVNNFLSRVLDEKGTHMGSLNLAFTRERLCRKKILVVLDDVDDTTVVQLGDLARHHDIFGPGSKVLFTSRNIHVLRNFHVDETFEVNKLDQDEALQLFVFNAFKNVCLTQDYLEQSKRVVNYTDGHPLAIKVLGSTLLDRSEEHWITILNKLEKFPKPSIMSILKISYDELSDEEKNIFLDIAFFFRGKSQNYVKNVLDSCYDFVQPSMTHLVENALITIDRWGIIEIHDLLQEMGFCIVHEQCAKDPGKRSRLLDPNDVYNVLTKRKGTDTIEGISLDLSKSRNMQLEHDAFARMSQLRILKFYNCLSGEQAKLQLPSEGLGFLSDELRVFHWEGFSSKSLPSNFCWEHIVELRMPRSNVKKLWTGAPHLVNLRWFNFTDCEDLIEIPDFSNAKNIESINLYGCGNLVTLHSSAQYLNKLQFLNLNSCQKLRNLPRRLDSTCLNDLRLSGSNVQKFPEIAADCLETLCSNEVRDVPRHLDTLFVSDSVQWLILNDTAIEEIPSSIQYFTSLMILDLSDNRYLSALPTTICKLKSLSSRGLRNCPKLEEFPEILEPMQRLRTLRLSGCVNLKKLPRDISNLISLELLDISNCKLIRFVPELPRSLWELRANNCESLETLLSKDIRNIGELRFKNCYRLDEKTRERIMAVGRSRKKRTPRWFPGEDFSILLPGHEIPKWFRYRSLGSSVTVPWPLPSHYNHMAGITFCFVRETSPHCGTCNVNVRFKCHGKGNTHDGEFELYLPWDETRSDHLMILYQPFTYDLNDYFPTEHVLSQCSALSYEFSFEREASALSTEDDDGVLRECAVHLHFAEDSGSSGEEYYSCTDDEGYYSCNDS